MTTRLALKKRTTNNEKQSALIPIVQEKNRSNLKSESYITISKKTISTYEESLEPQRFW